MNYEKLNVLESGPYGSNYRVRLKLDGASATASYRARMFYRYGDLTGFSGPSRYGLFVETDGGKFHYDDWDCAFRPPRADNVPDGGPDHRFNTEIVAEFSNAGIIDITLHGEGPSGHRALSSVLGGHSVGTVASQFLVERKDSEVHISSVSSAGGVVTVVTDGPHGFSDGDAISIYGIPTATDDTSDHTMGPDGERYMGTFRISVDSKSPETFTYTTAHYAGSAREYRKLTEATASKWVAVVQNVPDCVVGDGGEDLRIDCQGIGSAVREGDYVMLVRDNGNPVLDVCAKVLDAEADSIHIECPPDAAHGSGFGICFCGASPSGAVPVNWPEYALTYMENSPVYDHTVNTVKIEPARDAAFSYNGGTAQGKTTALEVSSDSVAVFSFTPPLALATNDGGADLNIYVTGMTDGTGSIVLYQMTSGGWEYAMTLDAVRSMVSDVPISSAELQNPDLSGDIGYQSFHIQGSTVRRWITEGNRYPMSIAAVYVGTGKAYLLSSESEFPPYMVVTGGAKAVEDPVQFALVAQVGHAAPGSLVRFSVQDGYEIDDSVFSDSFWFVGRRGDQKETEAFIVSGSTKYVDVIIPDDLNGDYIVELRGKRPDGTEVVLTDGSCQFYVDGNPQMRVVKLASKVPPGTMPSGKISYRGIYTRDFAFDGFVDITDGNSLIQNVYSILLTRRGERLFMPNFGTTLEDRIFDLMMEGDDDNILTECVTELREHEPRVNVSMADSYVEINEGGNGMVITLALELPAGVKQVIRLPFKSRGLR